MPDEDKNFDLFDLHEKRVEFVLKRLFPELAFRMEFLKHLKNNWPSIIRGNISRLTRPLDFRGGILYIDADNPQAAQMLLNMKGNIKRACLKISSVLNLQDIKIIQGYRAKNNGTKNNAAKKLKPEIKITDAEIKNVIDNDLNIINPDAAYAIAHLRVFFEKRFKK